MRRIAIGLGLMTVVLATAQAGSAAAPCTAAVTALADNGTEVGDTAVLVCTADACRGTMPLVVLGRQCQLSVHLAVPGRDERTVPAIFVVAGCEPPLHLPTLEFATHLSLGPRWTLSSTVPLVYGATDDSPLRELVIRYAVARVRVDFARLPGAAQR